MTDIFPAHIRKDPDGQEHIQFCQDHCRSAAVYAGRSLSYVGLQSAAYLAGLLHDMGKFTVRYREYIERASCGESVVRGSVNHTFAAVHFLLESYHDASGCQEYKDIVSELLAYATGAHHGLFDCLSESKESGFLYRLQKADICYDEAVQEFLNHCADTSELDTLFAASVDELTLKLQRCSEMASWDSSEEYGQSETHFYTGLLARLLLSAVLEGDRRDTAEFMNQVFYPEQPEDMHPIWFSCLQRIEAKLKSLDTNTSINQARQFISRQCLQMADAHSGVYRLNVPTGGGKTLSALRYSVAHAARWNKRRIIFVAPLLSILDQNAQVIRDYVQNDDLILEHHSNVIRIKDPSGELDPKELLAENWNSPIIITTLVQLLNTIFSGNTTAIRRFQALCNSVIVIDEVQTVPTNMLTLFNLAVNFLSEICSATIVLCSATQPCLEQTAHSLLTKPVDLVPYNQLLWKPFKRTQILPRCGMLMDEIPALVEETLVHVKSLLIICNTKQEAQQLYDRLKPMAEHCFHLSASMCVAHRRETLDSIEKSFDKPGKTICIATQVIEAGVDISFGCVIRLLAGMDSVVQAAGRCNRHGESQDPVPVYLIQCSNESLPSALQEIKQGQDATQELLDAYSRHPEMFDWDLASDTSIARYYHSLYRRMSEGYQDYLCKGIHTQYSLLSNNSLLTDEDAEAHTSHFFLCQSFALAGKTFQVFDSQTTDILVPYGNGQQLIADLCSERAKKDPEYVKDLLAQAKLFSVSVFDHQIRKLSEQGALISIHNDSILVLQEGIYDNNTGLPTLKSTQEVSSCSTLIL